MPDLGIQAPYFNLKDTITHKTFSFKDIKGENGTLIMFICNHCPYVVHVMPELVKLTKEYQAKGIGIAAINSNDIEAYPQDSPEKMVVFTEEWKMDYPYLFDPDQSVAKAYYAACTPDFYLFDRNDKLVYRGRLDDSRPRVENPAPLTGKDLRNALDLLLNNQPIPSENQFPGMGCNIKWKKD